MTKALGIPQKTRELVIERDSVRDVPTCQWCGHPIWGAYSLQHRRARGMGGSRRTDTNDASNLVLVHGTGTTECHGYIESHPRKAEARGFRISQHRYPEAVPIDTVSHGMVKLTNDGGVTPAERAQQ